MLSDTGSKTLVKPPKTKGAKAVFFLTQAWRQDLAGRASLAGQIRRGFGTQLKSSRPSSPSPSSLLLPPRCRSRRPVPVVAAASSWASLSELRHSMPQTLSTKSEPPHLGSFGARWPRAVSGSAPACCCTSRHRCLGLLAARTTFCQALG